MSGKQKSFFTSENSVVTPRQIKEQGEEQTLSPYAQLSGQSRGRMKAEEECEFRTIFERDTGRILYSLPFRRLRHKTQVFFSPQNDHVCTRMEHVLYVSYLAEVIGSALNLNTQLIRAIAMGHDLGHAPFGHSGENVLNELVQQYGGEFSFQHELHSLRVVDLLTEHNGKAGLNLSFEVRDGIVSHCGEQYDEYTLRPDRTKTEADLVNTKAGLSMPATLEACVVRLCDRIAYVGRDIEDAERSNLLSFAELPLDLRLTLGENNSDIVNTLVQNVIINSRDKDEISMSPEIGQALQELTEINVTRIYNAPKVRRFERESSNIIEGLFEHFLKITRTLPQDRYDENSQKFFEYYGQHPEFTASPARKIVDYIAGMTDSYARRVFSAIYQL
ncbi:MAG: HD domain-containing protein [Eubacteriales bacterium]|nr:HD domain-containing protein [Eubacteriales bacterium]MDD4324728.1 HD domain-containing protein [Eubacteriales bacterium]MDD4541722.1 HD domain-containing protein [Eubacteriales bacterium]